MNQPTDRAEVPAGRVLRGPDFSNWMPLSRVRNVVLFDADGQPITAAVTTQTAYDVVRRLPELRQVARIVLESATHRVEIVIDEDDRLHATVKLGPDGGIESTLDCAKVYVIGFNGDTSASPSHEGLTPVISRWAGAVYPARLVLELASGTEVGLTLIALDGVNYVLVDFWQDSPRLH